jgi:hypothetical protein
MCDSQPNRVAPPILPHTLQLSINHIPMLFLSLTSLPPIFDYPPKDPHRPATIIHQETLTQKYKKRKTKIICGNPEKQNKTKKSKNEKKYYKNVADQANHFFFS